MDTAGSKDIGQAIDRIALLISQAGKHPAPVVCSMTLGAHGAGDPVVVMEPRRGRENAGLIPVVLNVNFPQ